MITATQQTRVDSGLCPNCGKDAAPFYLCIDCRATVSVGRVMTRLEKHNFARSQKKGRSKFWFSAGDTNRKVEDFISTRYPLWGEGKGEDDKRLRPRLRGVPVNVKETIKNIFRYEDRGLTIEEINMAWGKLRAGRPRDSAAADMRTIIVAERKRQRKAEKLRKAKAPVCSDAPEALDSLRTKGSTL